MGDYEAERRIAIMGYRSVGKSSLTLHFVDGKFIEHYDPTIEQTFTKTTPFFGRNFKLHIVDTAGQDEYTQMPHRYSTGIHGYIIVYAINSQRSFDIVNVILQKIRELQLGAEQRVPILIVGNKNDLKLDREVQAETAKQWASKMNVPFMEITARDSQSAQSVFKKAVEEIEKSLGNIKDTGNSKPCSIS